ncbi:hypothetical protein COB72_09245 [bacterium]|nr:MAG: hypothetical protein COB72_09245 [bacterium]
MNYADLQTDPATSIIKLGRDRKASCRLLSPAETHAIRRALPEPEAPIIKDKSGSPMVNDIGIVLRDEGESQYTNKSLQWIERFRTAILAISMDYIASDGQSWNRGSLVDPADGRRGIGDEKNQVVYKDAESKRRSYIQSVVADFLGDDQRTGLMTSHELYAAYSDYGSLNMGELVAKSAEGNSGSAAETEQAAVETND